MYKKVQTELHFVERELAIKQFWNENKIFQKSIDNRDGSPVFTFYDGPPTANGKPHIGHIITRAIKDIIPRYKTMKGFKVLRKAGWDTHGLPVELEIEKSLGLSGKPDIEKYGILPFIQKCKESVWKYETEWREMSERVGFWADMDNPYVTYHNSYIESVWWAIKKIWDKDLLYKGHKIVPYCPRCGTALSSHEVAQGYKDVKENSVFVKFKRKDVEEYFLVWTTTPWTLPSNVALAVNAHEDYVKVSFAECKEHPPVTLIMAEALLNEVLGDNNYQVLERMKGQDLEYVEYEPLFDFVNPEQKAFYVTCDDYVTLTDGSGIVHIAPAFGEDDARLGNNYKLPFVQLVNEQGCFVEEVATYKGLFVKDADPIIIKDLRTQSKLFKVKAFEHSYPFCWRCDTPLLYYARDTWFIKMSQLRKNLVQNNNTVNWLPENIKAGRFGNFLENVIDWGISRERYWGTPLPIWECGCGHRLAIGSIEELKSLASHELGDIELHKPFIDEVKVACPACKGEMKRVSEVIDCWFDSGSMPFAQWHYPFENEAIFNENFPADFISEAVDQTRGWFYTLMAISTLLFDRSPYKNVIVLGLVQDKDGQKMSKHKGNVIDPWTVLNKQGADAVRWYFYTNSAPWLPSRFYEEAVNEAQRKFMGTLWNTYAFYVLYANIDQFDPKNYTLDYEKLSPMDKWILSRLNTLISYVDSSLENYKITEPARALNDFVDELSNWYVRRSRERFWGKDMPQDKINAYMTLYHVLVTLSKLSAPFVPFMAEEMYQNLMMGENGSMSAEGASSQEVPTSVHLCDFPVANPSWVDKQLEKNIERVLDIVVLGRSSRNNANIKNRQPVRVLYVCSEETLEELYLEIIRDELNLKSVEFIKDTQGFIDYKFKPQLKTLGKKYGKLLPLISQKLAESNGTELMNSLKDNKEIHFSVTGDEGQETTIVLTEDDVLIEIVQKEGFVVETDKGLSVVLDTKLSEELIEEGFVRELVSKLQTMRKEAGFEVMDKISVKHEGNEKIAAVIERNKEKIQGEVLAVAITEGRYESVPGKSLSKDWNINGYEANLSVLCESVR